MPQKVDGTPSTRSRRLWTPLVGLLIFVPVVLMVGRNCARQTEPAIAARVTPEPAPVAATPVPAVAPVATPPAADADTSAFQMRALVFELDANGIQARHSAIANGRVKAPPNSTAPRRLEFEVYGPDGSVTYAGAFDHPLWQKSEVVDDKGEFTAAERQVEKGSCFVRIPAELPANRIDFFDVDAMAGSPSRRLVGSFELP